jgi:hypothetical protein
VHCALFVAKQANMTFAKCGDFTVSRGEEFASLLRSFSGAEFVGDGPNGISSACNAAPHEEGRK